MQNLYVKQLKVGPMANFVYLIGCPQTKKALVVDPAWDIEAIEAQAKADGYEIAGALLTHYHPDHCGGHLWGHDIPGVAELGKKYDIPLYAHSAEIPGLSLVTGLAASEFKSVQGGDQIPVGKISITAVHTPGHTPGSLCFCTQGQLVSGDTLFLTGCGRVDLPGGNADQLFTSLHTTLGKLPDETIVLPGHDYDAQKTADLGTVRRINPYLKAKDLAEWRAMRL